MSDPADPSSWSPAGIVAAVLSGLAALATAVAAAWRAVTGRGEAQAEIRDALAALRAAVEDLRVTVQKSDKDLALIAHTLGEKSARNDRLEGRLDALEKVVNGHGVELARIRGYESGIRRAEGET